MDEASAREADMNDAVIKICMAVLSAFDLTDDKLTLTSPINPKMKAFLQFCYQDGWISTRDLIEVAKSIIEAAGTERSYGQAQCPKHITSPHALAWCIKGNYFSAQQLASITFDYGDSTTSFTSQGDRLLFKVVRQLKEIIMV